MWVVHNLGYWLQPDSSWYPDQRTALVFELFDNAVAAAAGAITKIQPGRHTYADMCAKWGTP